MANETIELLAQHTVYDVQPLSIFTKGRADVAVVSTTFVARTSLDDSSLRGIAGGGIIDVQLSDDGRLGLTRARLDVEQTERGHRIRETLPRGGTTLAKGGDWQLTVLLPRHEVLPDGTAYEVMLARYSGDPAPQVFDGRSLPALGHRIALVWSGVQDPEIDLDYYYRKLSGGT